jgi:hypothetical protein
MNSQRNCAEVIDLARVRAEREEYALREAYLSVSAVDLWLVLPISFWSAVSAVSAVSLAVLRTVMDSSHAITDETDSK